MLLLFHIITEFNTMCGLHNMDEHIMYLFPVKILFSKIIKHISILFLGNMMKIHNEIDLNF